ncbi:MAG: TOBE domain-containing protein [Candidatus Loosdrechtia sp.]|uniref:TOBE domain-containing protein n=1 Tax=Candidatus Loosdrechtia sp. TaxID=3101272 RepID=UPI003A5FFDF0|nr:MAG: TOBE domain-containing protein [Candidatus Jettenia sp. AMX2]
MAGRLPGTIINITQGQIHAHVQILWKDIPLSVIVTRASCEDMHLAIGDAITVIIKGTDVMLAKSFSGMLSARNKAKGVVKQIIQGDVLSKVLVESQGDVFPAMITNTSMKEMDIRNGDEVIAIVKSTELILSKEIES